MNQDASEVAEHPGEKEFLDAVNAADPFTMVIKSHQCIEELLLLAISEALATPHALELRRLSFSLKAELATALACVPLDSLPLLLKINKLRNSFAHDRRASFTAKQASELFGCLSRGQKQALGREISSYGHVIEIFRECATLIDVQLEATVTRMRDDKVRERILLEEAWSVISQKPADVAARREMGSKRQQKIEERVNEERKQRNKRGAL
jgi:hypothetical protein